MAARKTIAIVMEDEQIAQRIVNKFSTEQFRILFVTKNALKFKEVAAGILGKNQYAEVEIIDCPREGCWEADLILLAAAPADQEAIADAIREVAIQKMVINIEKTGFKEDQGRKKLEKLLPYSKVVIAQMNWPFPDIFLSSIDEDALQIASEIFGKSGYFNGLGKS